MRILIVSRVSGHGRGGLEAYVRRLSEELSVGHEVRGLARFGTRAPASSKFGTPPDAPRELRHGSVATHLLAAPAWQVPLLNRLIHFVHRPALAPLAIHAFNAAYRRSLRAAAPGSWDWVHYVGTGQELLGFLALEFARERGARFTIWPAVHPGTWGDAAIDFRLYRLADAVFVQSAAERAHLVVRGIPDSRIHQCGLAPACPPDGEASRFRLARAIGSRPIILFAGRQSRTKGFPALLEAWSMVREKFPEALLVTLGTPDKSEPAPSIPDGVLDLGSCSEEEKADAFAACDAFCLPSAAESFGIVFVEAWAYGKPVICGPAPACRELVEENVTGLWSSQDPSDIAAAITRLLADPSLRERLGRNGRALQQRSFTWPEVLRRHLAAIPPAP